MVLPEPASSGECFKEVGFASGVRAVIDYLKNEIKTVGERSVGEPKLKAHLNAVEKVLLQTVVNALEEWQATAVHWTIKQLLDLDRPNS